MPYTIDPQDSAQPTDLDPAGSGAAELRALKAYIATLIGTIPVQNFNYWQGFRNRLINGGKEIDQEHVGGAVTLAATGYVVDGWILEMTQASKITSVVTTAARGALQATPYLQKYTVAAAVAVPAIGDYFAHTQPVEGFSVRDLLWGTANARSAVYSFVVEASIAGVYPVTFRNAAQNRCYTTSFTVNAANTQEYKYIVVPGDTAGVWPYTEGVTGLYVTIGLGAGATYTTANANVWQAGNYVKLTGCVDFVSTLAATIYITNEQFERGTVPTPYEVQPFDEVLKRCQRQYEKTYELLTAPGTATPLGVIYEISGNSANGDVLLQFPYKVQKCKPPSVSVYSPNTGTVAKIWDLAAGDRAAVTTQANATNGTWRGYATNGVATTLNSPHSAHFVANARLT